MHESPAIFVLEIAEGPDLAFQADGATKATAIARARWLRDAIENLLAGSGQAGMDPGDHHLRAATAAEARIYGRLREEFDEPANQFLIANLSGFRERDTKLSAGAPL